MVHDYGCALYDDYDIALDQYEKLWLSAIIFKCFLSGLFHEDFRSGKNELTIFTASFTVRANLYEYHEFRSVSDNN